MRAKTLLRLTSDSRPQLDPITLDTHTHTYACTHIIFPSSLPHVHLPYSSTSPPNHIVRRPYTHLHIQGELERILHCNMCQMDKK